MGTTSASKPARPVNVKFYVDAEYLKSAIDLGFIESVKSYDTLSEENRPKFLETKAV